MTIIVFPTASARLYAPRLYAPRLCAPAKSNLAYPYAAAMTKRGFSPMRCSKRYMARLCPFERLAEKTKTYISLGTLLLPRP